MGSRKVWVRSARWETGTPFARLVVCMAAAIPACTAAARAALAALLPAGFEGLLIQAMAERAGYDLEVSPGSCVCLACCPCPPLLSP